MVQFDKLRLSGFKSFVDPTELAIEPGMTGIVGPNGCGKSNLVEALKWVMGETSAKQMRGSEMEDVIFAGTGQRPARNIAEVMLSLDNKTRTAPAMVNDTDQLDVVRRIERGHGSAYSVNGREIRARDVQTLFADAATGSRSTALVSQGRIGALINAKPADRRSVIDEAAGITGLYARRHEAELRLRAAEQNLARVQDVLVALEEQHKGLKRQARQASRYRNLSDHIRRAEAAVLALKLATAERDLAELGRAPDARPRPRSPISRVWSVLPPRRRPKPRPRCRRCATTRPPPLPRLQRLRVAHDALTAEAERVAAGAVRGRDAPAADRTRISARERAARAMPRPPSPISTASANASKQERVGEEDRAAAAEEARDTARAETSAAEAEHDRLTRQIADDEALRQSVAREIAELQERLRRLPSRRDEVTDAAAPGRDRTVEPAGAGRKSRPHSKPPVRRSKRRAPAARRRSRPRARPSATSRTPRARPSPRPKPSASTWSAPVRPSARPPRRATPPPSRSLQKTNARLTKLRAEEAGVAAALKSAANSLWPPLLDALTVEPGFEKALGAAFGDELEASSDRGAPVHWLPLDALAETPALPEGATPLGAHVGALPELARRLAFIGIVADDDTGAALQASLKPGQQLVTPRRRGLALGRLHDARRCAVDRRRAAEPAQPPGRDPPSDRRHRRRAGGRTGARRRREDLARRGPRCREDLRRAGPRP